MNKKNVKLILINVIFLVVALGIIGSATYYSIKLAQLRSRDAQRVEDLSSVKSSIEQRYKMYKSYPPNGYESLNQLGIFMSKTPNDPINSGNFRYYYVTDGKSFVLYVKMEGKNYYATHDSGKYNKKPLYYETGSGENWQELIPGDLK